MNGFRVVGVSMGEDRAVVAVEVDGEDCTICVTLAGVMIPEGLAAHPERSLIAAEAREVSAAAWWVRAGCCDGMTAH
jgi:hypothetical protein